MSISGKCKNFLSKIYKREEFFPPKPYTTLKQIRDNDDEDLWEVLQGFVDEFFYFLCDRNMISGLGIEFGKEVFEELINLGVFQIAFWERKCWEDSEVLLLHWKGTYYKVSARFTIHSGVINGE
jgi:hypothetical protein